MFFLSSCVLSLLLITVFAQDQLPLQPPTAPAAVSLNVWTKNGTRNDTAPLLYGVFFEDIAHSGDGGLYAELLRNRAFQGSGAKIGSAQHLQLPGNTILQSDNPTIPFGPVLDGWFPVGDGVRLSLDLLHPLSDALQVSLQVDIPVNATGQVGFKNDGWWGIPVSPQTYSASFHCQTNGFRWNNTLTHFNVSLRDNATSEIFASETVHFPVSEGPVPWTFKNYSTQLTSTISAPSIDNAFTITMDAAEARGQTFYFNLLSLFPETYKNRPNGLRKDLAETLEQGGFKFNRFPGGNNLEGYSVARRWKWWQTIGPLKDRPGRPGDWSYFNTDGLGLLEYMYWCEDMDLVPILAVYAGFSLDVINYDSGNSTDRNEIPVSMMGPVLQEALDELEFLMGGTETYWGAKRAEYGHPEPFHVPYVEIGNEDFFGHDYPARAKFMLEGLKEKYPDIVYIYTAPGNDPQTFILPEGVVWDKHIYSGANQFIDLFSEFDNWHGVQGDAKFFASIMEYHVNAIDQVPGNPSHNLSLITTAPQRKMLAAVAEAIYALGWERNPDTVRLSCFAPMIQNSHVWRHTPYLFLFDADPKNTIISTSYYWQRLFALHHGTQSLPITVKKGNIGPLYWHAAIDEQRGEVYVKVVNTAPEEQVIEIELDVDVHSLNGTTMHPPLSQGVLSTEDERDVVLEPISGLEDLGALMQPPRTRFSPTLPPWSVNVLQFNLRK